MTSGPRWTRREFLQRAGCLGALAALAPGRILPMRRAGPAAVRAADEFRWRSASIGRIPELRDWMTRLDAERRLSADKTWRGYIGSFQYAPPREMAGARSLVIMALPLRIAAVTFIIADRRQRVRIPPGYADDGRTLDDYRGMLYRAGIVPDGARLERARLPLKQLAVRSGLAAYGRNNIAYVDGYGSHHQLLAFYCERELEDHWGPLKLLRECKGCSLCLRECPTGAIRAQDFIIDPGRCITLYNELPAPIPAWIPASAHNALVGCLKCQAVCPANEGLTAGDWDLGELNGMETAALLAGRPDAAMARVLKARLARVGGGDDLAYIARNLKLVLDAAGRPPQPRP